MRVQLEKAGTPAPIAIGIDEISVGDGHDYRIVVSDLVRGRAIWFGGTDRSEASRRLGHDRRLAVEPVFQPLQVVLTVIVILVKDTNLAPSIMLETALLYNSVTIKGGDPIL
jgi:hypothetical protein